MPSAAKMAPKTAMESKAPGIEAMVTETASAGRITITASINQRGTTIPIDIQTITDLCGDGDGCDLRLGMYNWDGQGRKKAAQRCGVRRL